jgi:pimeloyl-ACP methyl ester carboxylesterase
MGSSRIWPSAGPLEGGDGDFPWARPSELLRPSWGGGFFLTSDRANEVPVFFPAGNDTLFGVLSLPSAPARGCAVVLLTGGGFHTSAHVNRIYVRLARRMAASGYHALRLDYHGTGESTGRIGQYRLDQPFVGDLLAAIGFLRRHGITRYILVGVCLGGRTSLAAAPSIDGVEAVALLGSPLGDLQMREGTAARRASKQGFWSYMRRGLSGRVLRRFLPPYSVKKQLRIARAHLRVGIRTGWARLRKRLFRVQDEDKRLWISPNFTQPLQATLQRKVPVLFLYGSEDPFLGHFMEARSGVLASLFHEEETLIDVRTIEGEVSLFPKVRPQEEMIDIVAAWILGLQSDSSVSEQDPSHPRSRQAGVADGA